ncbi:MAG: BamA/TamA family outer membrane protein [Polyangiaceae bacterium]
MNLRGIGLVFALLASGAKTARAEDALNSSDKPTPEEQQQKKKEPPDGKFELNVVPIVGGSTDIGIGGGVFGGLSRVKKGHEPFLWDVQTAATFTFREHNGALQSPYQDVYVKLIVPQFLGLPLRLEVRPSYTWEQTLGYYGVGNASVAPSNAASGYEQYGRLHPAFDVFGRLKVVDHVAAQVGMRYTQNSVQVDPSSKLAQDLASADPEIHSLVHGPTGMHGVALFQYGLQWDNRDNEVSTHSGMFHEITVKASPGGTPEFPYRYGQANAKARFYIPIIKPRLTLALRAVVDALVGDPPFYELSRFDDTYAIGGSNGVRGVPGQRYSGKIKAFGNIELRSEIVKFRALKKNMIFGAVGFFDGGRVWADWKPEPQLDGTGLGLKYGTGGGLRLQSGDTFVIRLDVAWSPDATPIGAYFGADQMF